MAYFQDMNSKNKDADAEEKKMCDETYVCLFFPDANFAHCFLNTSQVPGFLPMACILIACLTKIQKNPLVKNKKG